MDFVKYLIRDDPKWSTEKIDKILADGREQTITIMNPLNVHILYLTAWSEDGILHFRKDLYDRDPAVLKALNEPAPAL